MQNLTQLFESLSEYVIVIKLEKKSLKSLRYVIDSQEITPVPTEAKVIKEYPMQDSFKKLFTEHLEYIKIWIIWLFRSDLI